MARGYNLILSDPKAVPSMEATEKEIVGDIESVRAVLSTADYLAPVPPALLTEDDPSVIEVWLPRRFVRAVVPNS